MKKERTISSDEISVDIVRIEEEWTENNENFIEQIKIDCKNKFNIHNIASHKFKKKHIITAIPIIILPLILANLTLFIKNTVIFPILLTFLSILNGLSILFNFSKKGEMHDQHASKYNQLSNEIDSILIRKKKFRNAFDVCMSEITSKKSFLDLTAPFV